MVMDKVTDMMDYVMGEAGLALAPDGDASFPAETIDSDECYGCDGIFQKRTAHAPSQGACGRSKPSDKLENNVESETGCNTTIEGVEKKKERSDKFLNMPSQVEQEVAIAHTAIGVTDTHDPSPSLIPAVTVGDRVEISDCPGHWSWGATRLV